MKNLNHNISPRISVQSLLIFGIGLVTLALWMLPALAGNGSPYDPIVCTIWTIALIGLLTLNYIRVLHAETRERTVYLDRTNRKLYNERIGIVSYGNPCQLTVILTDAFAKTTSTTHHKMPNPDEFQLSAIIRTTSFDSLASPSSTANNTTINEWTGVIEVPGSNEKLKFESLGELEDMLCPLMNVDAISMVGQCPDVHTESCLCNERIVRNPRI